jgi:exodeoxyribonuclease VII small subunit
MPKTKKSVKEPRFEEALASLERIVRDLEGGDLPLDDALKLFEEGVRLSRFCSKKLDEAEKRIEILMRSADGDDRPEPFRPEGEEESGAPSPEEE